MHLDQVARCTRLDDVYHHLDNFPRDLDDVYDEAWYRATSDSNSPVCQRAKMILTWVTHVERPLTIEALGEALVASGSATAQDLLTMNEILSSCDGLVRIETLLTSPRFRDEPGVNPRMPDELIVTLRHPSVYRYFDERRAIYFPGAHDLIAVACLLVSDPNQLFSSIPGYRALITE